MLARASRSLAAFVLAFTISAPAAAAPGFYETLGRIQEHHLQNGLTVVVQEDHRVPLVSLAIRYDAGTAEEPEDAPGVATVTRQLMERTSAHVPPGTYGRLLARAGATSWSQRTTRDASIFDVTLPAARLDLALWLWSDQMGFFSSAIDDAQVDAARAMVRERFRSALEGAPLGRLEAIADDAIFPAGHPYHHPFLASPQAVDAIDLAKVHAFHDRWVTPEHAILSIVGDVTADDAFALVNRYFGSIARSSASAPRLRPAPVTLAGETQIELAADEPVASVAIRWPTPPFLTSDDARLDIVAHLFSGQRTAWLVWKLMDDKKVASSVSVQQRSFGLVSRMEVFIDGVRGQSAAQLLAAYDTAMDEIAANTLGEADIRHAAYEMLAGRADLYERATNRAGEYATFEALVGTADYLRHDFMRYDGIAPSAIRATIDRWMPRDRRVVILVVPTAGALPGGERRGTRFTPASAP